MKRPNGTFLVCDGCGYSCYVRGELAVALSENPPECPGCRGATRVARREPWRETTKSLDRAS